MRGDAFLLNLSSLFYYFLPIFIIITVLKIHFLKDIFLFSIPSLPPLPFFSLSLHSFLSLPSFSYSFPLFSAVSSRIEVLPSKINCYNVHHKFLLSFSLVSSSLSSLSLSPPFSSSATSSSAYNFLRSIVLNHFLPLLTHFLSSLIFVPGKLFIRILSFPSFFIPFTHSLLFLFQSLSFSHLL